MANFGKPPKVGSGPIVRQKRGPGMNLGLKKPRYGKFTSPPADASPKKRSSLTDVADSASYLSPTLLPGAGKSRPPKGGKPNFSKKR